jgi:hypothetical protein
MSSGNGSHADEHASFPVKVAASERFARAIVVAFAVCEEARIPLSDVQKIAIIEAALLEFDGLEGQLDSLAGIGELLRSLR